MGQREREREIGEGDRRLAITIGPVLIGGSNNCEGQFREENKHHYIQSAVSLNFR